MIVSQPNSEDGPEKNPLPVFDDSLFNLMIPSDQSEYQQLYQYFLACEEKNKRNHGMDTFVNHLIKVHRFINQRNVYDVFRGFVCGIEFGAGFIIVNTKRLKRLMCRSKSCVNGCLQRLGFAICRKQQDVTGFFSVLLPGVDGHLCNSRQWCVRKRTEVSPVCFVSFLPISITDRYGFPKPVDCYGEEEDAESPQPKTPAFSWDIRSLLNQH